MLRNHRWTWIVPSGLLLFAFACGGGGDTAAPVQDASSSSQEPSSQEPSSQEPSSQEPAGGGGAEAQAPRIEIRNARVPADGLLVGGQPSEEELRQAAEAGYRTVVNTRTEGEEGEIPGEAELVAELGMEYVFLPVAGAEGLTDENVRVLDEILDDPASYPVMVHCASGNRVGALLALRAHRLEGRSPEDALAFGLEAGLTRLEPAVRQELGLPGEPAE